MASKIHKLFFVALAVFAGSAFAQDPTPPCLRKLEGSDAIRPLAGKVPVNVSRGQPLELLASTELPTTSEKAALASFAAEYDRCFSIGSDWRRDNTPSTMSGLVSKYHTDTLLLLADLYAGKLTYGDVAKTRARQFTEFSIGYNASGKEAQAQKLTQDRQQVEADRRQAAQTQQQEAARRQAAIESLSNVKPPTPLEFHPMQIPHSTTTNCQTIGNQMNCRTN